MVKGKGRLASALKRQQDQERERQLKKRKIENKQINYPDNKKGKPKSKQSKNLKIQENQKPFVPFNLNDRILLIGEGDFSFTLSIVKLGLIKPNKIITTSFDSFDEISNKYGDLATDNINELKKMGVIYIYHGIDGTNIANDLGLGIGSKKSGNGSGKSIEKIGGLLINNVIFNFPHVGLGIKNVDRNIRENQKMLSRFFKSCTELFDILKKQREASKNRSSSSSISTSIISNENELDDEVDLNKMSADDAEWYYQTIGKNIQNKQIDESIITVSLFMGEPYDSWQIKKLARDSVDYCVQRSGAFVWDFFEGYHHRRTAGLGNTNKEATQREARIYKFEKFQKILKKKNKKDESDSEEE